MLSRTNFCQLVLAGLMLCGTIRADPVLDALDAEDAPHNYLIHLPGIAGPLSIDQEFIRGLKGGGYRGQVEIYDWTEADPGLDALRARKRNEQEAASIARKIAGILESDPLASITLTSHSGGTGLAVWALERLPADVHIQTLLLLSSALSPTYDLSAALRHVSGRAYSFASESDILVLSAGTRTFGTIDGVECDAAGKVGFHPPPRADPAAYRKLTQRPFEREWMALGNIGDHIGTLRRQFAQQVLAPILVHPGAQPTPPCATTAPSTIAPQAAR